NLVWDEDGLSVTLGAADDYDIDIQVVVTDVHAWENVDVTNTATATDADGYTLSASDTLTLNQYDDFIKELEWANSAIDGGGTVYDPDALPVETNIFFRMYIDLENTTGNTMEGVEIKDNLGGDLELHSWVLVDARPPTATDSLVPGGDGGSEAVVKKKGETKKVQLKCGFGNLTNGGEILTNMDVSTDENPGQGKKTAGKNEYTDEVDTEHDLNSGATLKFTDSVTGLRCSVSTEAITVKTDVD
ncbi:hypothetical protein ACFLV5_06240, partial [Chloroflexota bacterium]